MIENAHMATAKGSRRLATAIVLHLLLYAGIVVAQGQSGLISEGQIRRPHETVPAMPGTDVSESNPAPDSTPLAEVDDLEFPLEALSVSGATVFESAQLIQPFEHRLGQRVTLSEIQRIAAEMTARYRNSGYILSQVYVPPQRIEGGKVQLVAIEGYLADVQFQGDLPRGSKPIRTELTRKLTASRPLQAEVLERSLLLLNDYPGMFAAGTLVASQHPGATDLITTVSTDPVTFGISGDNRISALLGDEQINARFGASSFFGLSNDLQLAYGQSTGDGELRYFFGKYTHVLKSGSQLHLQASHADATPALAEDLSLLNIETDARDFSITWDYPWKRTRKANVRLVARVTFHEGVTDEAFFGDSTEDTLAAIRLGMIIDAADSVGGVNVLQVEYHQGLDAFGASSIDDVGLSRAGGDPEFRKLTYYAARLQHLFGRWQVLLAVRGQYAMDNLLSPEEFAFGGELFGRGYDSSELVGDHGLAGKVELRHTFNRGRDKGLTTYAFFDSGRVRQIRADGEIGGNDSAESFGAGFRASFGRGISAFVEVAKPKQVVIAEESDDLRVFGGLTVRF